jgi:hypothetical protein
VHQRLLLEMRQPPQSVRMRQHRSACVSMLLSIRQHASACVSIRQHTSAYVSIRQHTSRNGTRMHERLSCKIRSLCATPPALRVSASARQRVSASARTRRTQWATEI